MPTKDQQDFLDWFNSQDGPAQESILADCRKLHDLGIIVWDESTRTGEMTPKGRNFIDGIDRWDTN